MNKNVIAGCGAIVLAIVALFSWSFNEKLVCETRNGERAVQLVSYEKFKLWLPLPMVGRPDWFNRRFGVRVVDRWQSKWLTRDSDDSTPFEVAACQLAVVNAKAFAFYPVRPTLGADKNTFDYAAWGIPATHPKSVLDTWITGMVIGNFPFFHFGALEPSGVDMELHFPGRSGTRRGLIWATAQLTGVGDAVMTATQYGSRAGIKNSSDFFEQAYRMGRPASAGEVSAPVNSLLALKRRLRSKDGGRTWELDNWELLRPDLLPVGSTITPICPC